MFGSHEQQSPVLCGGFKTEEVFLNECGENKFDECIDGFQCDMVIIVCLVSNKMTVE